MNGPNDYIIGLDEMTKYMYKMITNRTALLQNGQFDEMTAYPITMVMWEVDFNYKTEGRSLLSLIKELLDCGGSIVIITSKLGSLNTKNTDCGFRDLERLTNQYPLTCNTHLLVEPSDCSQNCLYNLNWELFSKHEPIQETWKWIVKKMGHYDINIHGYHLKFIYDGNILFNGHGFNSIKYSGGLYDTVRGKQNELPYSWYDTALVYKTNANERLIIEKVIESIKDGKSFLSLCETYPFIFNNNETYKFILHNIKHSRKSIYIENQYFYSCDGITQNKISKSLEARIIRAINKKQKFHCKLIINELQLDELLEPRMFFGHCLTQMSIPTMISNIIKSTGIAGEQLHQYLTIMKPSNSICIHSKVFIFDNSIGLHTSANIYDASFHSRGHIEFGAIIKDKALLRRMQRSIPQHFLVPFTSFDIGYTKQIIIQLLTFIKPNCIQLIANVEMPIHKQLARSVYKTEQICDNLLYKSKHNRVSTTNMR